MSFWNNVLNSIPVVGHLRAIEYDNKWNREARAEALHSANRTTACTVGAILGGPWGAVVGGNAVDFLHKRGNWQALAKIREGNTRDVFDGLTDIVSTTGFDFLGGKTLNLVHGAGKGFVKEATKTVTRAAVTQAAGSSAAAGSNDIVQRVIQKSADGVEVVIEVIEDIKNRRREALEYRNATRRSEQNQTTSAQSGRNSEHQSANNSGCTSEANNSVQTATNYDGNGYESSSDDDEVHSIGSESESEEDESTDSQEKKCKALTANGERCENTAREGTRSCGLQAHITQINNAQQRNGRIYIFTLSNGNIKIGQTKRSVKTRLKEETQYPVKIKIKSWNCTDRVRAETEILQILREAQLRSERGRLVEVFIPDIVTREEAEETIREVVNKINREMTNENYPSEESEYLPDMGVVEDLFEEENSSDNDIDRS